MGYSTESPCSVVYRILRIQTRGSLPRLRLCCLKACTDVYFAFSSIGFLTTGLLYSFLALVGVSWSPVFSEKALLLSTTLIVIASAALDVSLCPAHSTIKLHSVSNILRELLLCASHVAQASQSYSTVVTVVSSGIRKPGLEAHL